MNGYIYELKGWKEHDHVEYKLIRRVEGDPFYYTMKTWPDLVKEGWTVELSVQSAPGTGPENISSAVTTPPDNAKIPSGEPPNPEQRNGLVGGEGAHSETPEEPTTTLHPNTEPEQTEVEPGPATAEALALHQTTPGLQTPPVEQQDNLPYLHKDAKKVDIKCSFSLNNRKVSTQSHEWVRCKRMGEEKEEHCICLLTMSWDLGGSGMFGPRHSLGRKQKRREWKRKGLRREGSKRKS